MAPRRKKEAVEAKRAWRLEESIWQGRQFRGGEDRGFYDDDGVVRRAIACDWQKAVGKGLLLPFLLKHDANAPDAAAPGGEAALAAFASEVEEVFIANGRLFFMIFDYYASLGNSDGARHRRPRTRHPSESRGDLQSRHPHASHL